MKHHVNQLANMATTYALASEFTVGIASTTMSEEQMQALHKELEPVLERVTDELKAVVNKHGIAFSGHGAALIGEATFKSPEDRAEFEREVMPVLALKTLLESTEGASGSFEA